MKTFSQIVGPREGPIVRGPISCIVWVTHRNENYETLCYGTGLVQSCFEELTAKRLGTGCEITCMVCDNTEETTRLVVATRDRIVQMWKLDLKGQVQSVFSVQLDVMVPKGVAFVENAAKDIYVFGLYDGNLYVHLESSF